VQLLSPAAAHEIDDPTPQQSKGVGRSVSCMVGTLVGPDVGAATAKGILFKTKIVRKRTVIITVISSYICVRKS